MFDIILRVVSVYFSFVKDYDIFKKITISDKARAEYVSSISSEKRKLQSIAVWKLLEYALKKDYSVLGNQSGNAEKCMFFPLYGKVNPQENKYGAETLSLAPYL